MSRGYIAKPTRVRYQKINESADVVVLNIYVVICVAIREEGYEQRFQVDIIGQAQHITALRSKSNRNNQSTFVDYCRLASRSAKQVKSISKRSYNISYIV